MHTYTRFQTLVNNLPYIMMTLLGSAIIALAFEMSAWAWIGGGAYLAYGILGALWIMIFICPYCGFHGTRSCPCGYGTMSARLMRKREEDRFSKKFKRHIPVIVPLWLIPPVAGVTVLVKYAFSWWLVGLLAAFAVNSFVILPLLSTRHSCSECQQKESCPWMKSREQGP